MPFTTRLHHHAAPSGGVPSARRRRPQTQRVAESRPTSAHELRRVSGVEDLTKYMYEGSYDADGDIGPYYVVPRCYSPQLGRFPPRDP